MEYVSREYIFKVDELIKLILSFMIICLTFSIHRPISILILSAFLLGIALISRLKIRTLLIGISSYMIIVIIPYLFGLWINNLLSSPLGHISFHDALLRLYRLFVIWFVSILYFNTTPLKTLLGLVDKLLTPLKPLGVPIDNYLKVIMCIIIEL